ncbi:MAG TPA: S41 family peptidase [Blastocatellia bacterium]|nr:S41 family peptidase [Blastocatellia bacterium]
MTTLKKNFIAAQLLLLVAAFWQAGALAQTKDALPYFTEPAISPDRSEIVFVSGGDIWSVASTGGEARLLVSHPANESRPLYSPDGRQLAFISSRTGNGDIYTITFATGELKRLTFDDTLDQLDGWSRDGRWIYFSSTSRDISGMNDIFRVSAAGGTPLEVSADRYVSEYLSAPSPDGRSLAFTARGVALGQWWRKGSSHIDQSEIWIRRDASPAVYDRLTDGGAKQVWPMWGADGRTVFYVSDRGGAQNIWSHPTTGQARPVTQFKDGRVVWPNVSYDGKAIVFERNFAIWKLDTATGQAAEVPITRRGAPAGPMIEHVRLTDQIQELALSPDGKKIAFVVRGEVFAASAKDGGDAARVTTSAANESQVAWSPDSRRLAYVSDRKGASHIFMYDFANNTETQVTNDARSDASPKFSPDGRLLAFERGARELRLFDLESKQERLLATAYLDRPPLTNERSFTFSPDSRFVAFMPIGDKLFRNVHVVPTAGGAAAPVSFLANLFSNSVSWSPDGTFILFDTGQRTEPFSLARIDLIPRAPRFREDQFRDLFKEETPRPMTRPAETRPTETQTPAQQPSAAQPPAAEEQKKPPVKQVNIVFEEIRRRLSLLPVGVDVDYHAISPDGKWVLMTASAAGQQNIYIYSLDELSREPAVARQLTSTPGFKDDAQFTPDGKEVFYLDQGRINVVSLETRQPRQLAVTAEMDVDFAREKLEMFNQAWGYLNDHFYDPNFHGVDWQRVRETYLPRVEPASTPDEMRRLIQLMVGELNASHLGISAPFNQTQSSTGRLGLRFDRAEYESAGRLRVTELIPLGPAALAGNIKPGDYLIAVDNVRIDSRTNLDELLAYKINRRVSLTVAATADGASPREVVVRPINSFAEKGLLYRKWVEEKRQYVARVSNGRLGYVHMFDMSSSSLAQLHVDLDAENHSREGVVIDVRNNSGGFVNVYAIDVMARRGYLTMTPRGYPAAPARTVLGQRALQLPTILVTNQHSLSDAEDFTEGYRTLKLGKVVGEPTAGWIIYTWNVPLIDGSTLRLPRMKVTANDGTNMELNPRPVDVPVTRPIGESYTDRDSQLDAAVRELLNQIKSPENGNRQR